ncbi:hypothetical protein AB0D99_16920 [Streptomyces sp. NPDC047971]|uniref:hypothetical protein n=1 Tax=Streptomyces sp. NPDC047971 TaxID=3154499 RepID=UPI0034009765
MLITYAIEDGVLHVTLLRDLDISTRAAASLETEALVHAHHPRHVRVQLPTFDPSPASLSALTRARRLCEHLGIPLTVVGPAQTSAPEASPSAPGAAA